MRYFILMIVLISFSLANEYKKILFISSYDLSFPTVKKQIQGINEVLDSNSFQVDMEFMDTKRLNAKQMEEAFFKMLLVKKELVEKYDAILVGDDNALHFVVKHQKRFFNKKPIVFLAINNIPFAKEVSKNRYITGVLEEQSINETIELIFKLHPKESKITAIIDNTTTAKGVINSFDKEVLKNVEFLNVSNYSFYDLKKRLEKITSNKPLLLISALLDKNLETKEFYQSLAFIKSHTNSPIYHFYEHGVEEGLIGGKVIIFKEQGRSAAKILKDVLQGKRIESIKPIKTENRYFFNYKELEKYDLLDEVPKNSILINKPKSFLSQPLINILIEVMVLFVIGLIFTLYLLYKLKKSSKILKEKTEEQKILLSLFNIGDSVLFKWRNDRSWSVSHVSSNVENLLGFSQEDFLNDKISYSSCIHKDDIQRVRQEAQDNVHKTFFRSEPYRLITKEKKIKWVIEYTVIVRNKNDEVSHYLGYLLDMTKEKTILNTLEKLVDSQSSMICLLNGKEITFANKKFYDFFACKSINEFHIKYGALSGLFIENDRFFHLGKIKEDDMWMEKIQELPENGRIVALANRSLQVCAFSVNANKFDEDLYLVSLNDITKTVMEQIKLEEKTIHDKLTGAYNREFFENYNKTIIVECKETNKLLAVAILDIDYFKKINDNYGHDVGDKVLKEFVLKVKRISREDDILIRWGGEEFILLLRISSKDALFQILESIRKKLEEHKFSDINTLTCSIGASIYEVDENIEKTIKRADISLYRAKAEGRNRVII